MSEIKLNDKLPVFSGVNQDRKVIYSQDFLGEKLVIFFYPKANTPGCTAEACNLSDNYHLLKKEGYEILGISVDNIEKQKKFHDKYSFPYDLIADDNKEISRIFGVWKKKKFMGREFMGVVRTTFVFDEEGICKEIIENVKTKEHATQILVLS